MNSLILPFQSEQWPEAGCDEAGRGCLAGPVVAAAVILDPANPIAALNDSKQLSAKKRMELRHQIHKHALAFGIGIADHNEIDQINILNASILAMHRAIDNLSQKPNFIIVDGNRFKNYQNIEHKCIIKGDSKFASIAAASILAKTERDLIMSELSELYPEYGWHKNQGYPTKTHRLAITNFGPCPLHRKTFKLLETQASLKLFD